MRIACLAVLVTGLSIPTGSVWGEGPNAPKLIPRTLLFGNPERFHPELSPSGDRYAYLAPYQGVLNIWTAPLGEEGAPLTTNTSRDIWEYFWAPDGNSVFYVSDNDGDENWALYAVDLAGGAPRVVTPSEGVQTGILAADPNHPDFILITLNKRDPYAQDVYRLDTATGDTLMVARNPGMVRFWIADTQLRVRGMHVSREDGGFDFLVRDTEDAPWREAAHWDLEDAVTSRPVGFSADGESVYLLDSRGVNTGRLVRLNLTDGSVTVLAEDPEYDVGDVFGVNLIRHPRTYAPQAVEYERERKARKFLDSGLEADYRRLSRVHPGDFTVLSKSRDDQVWFVAYEADTAPPVYFAFDRRTGESTLLFEAMPALKEYELAPAEPFTCRARDGLQLKGYVTYPAGVERRDLPLVVNPHGGPWFRDSWGFNPERQWLANRGYAVLNVNFRGSTRYGKAHVNAADHEWGRKMLYDLVDAARSLAERGEVDPSRVAVYGGSFGGYQALCGATFTPDFFAAAISVVGPSNLITQQSSFPPQWKTRTPRFHLRGGHPERDKDMLRERSPYFHAENIKAPMLIAQGANDPRVKQAESDQIVSKLRENGVEHEYLLFEDEGHGFTRPENIDQFYSTAEAFLAKHLGGRVEGPPQGEW